MPDTSKRRTPSVRFWYTTPMQKRVFIALKMAGIAGQDKLHGIFRYLGGNHDWDITLIRTAAEFTPERIRSALNEDYDGFIVSIPKTETTAALLAESTIPTIVIDIHDPKLSARKENIAFIRNSADEIGKAAASHLLSTGRCRSYAFIHHPLIVEWSVSRFRAFRETLSDYGLWCHELQRPEEISHLRKPIGVFAANDDRGYDTISYCRKHNLRIPEDVLVLGINNDTLICENCDPELSSIQPDFDEEGYIAAKTLDDIMNAPNVERTPRTLLIGVKQIVRRSSTAPVSHAGKLVQKALAYIRKNALSGISVEDVVRHLGCSRRLADLRFRELQNTTIGAAISEIRLEEVKRLLLSSQEPLTQIAASCGYHNANYLKNLFKRRFGMSMSAWRRQNAAHDIRPSGLNHS